MARSIARPVALAALATLALALAPHVSPTPARAAVVADTTALTTPTHFDVLSHTKGGQITLGWDASFDAIGVAGYRMYRDGVWQGTLYQAGVDLIGTAWYDRLGGRTKTPVTYALYAFDAAGNVSAPATLRVAP